jgi:hypothetical protein
MSPQSVAPDELSLAQTQFKGDVTPGLAARQIAVKPLIGGDFSGRLNGAVENAIIISRGAEPDTGATQDQRWQ